MWYFFGIFVYLCKSIAEHWIICNYTLTFDIEPTHKPINYEVNYHNCNNASDIHIRACGK